MEGAARHAIIKKFLYVSCVCVGVCVSGSGRGRGIGHLPDFFPACVHMHVECVDMLFCALSLWNELLIHSSMHARMISMPVTLEQTGLPQE